MNDESPIPREALVPLLERLRRLTGHDFTQYRDEVLHAQNLTHTAVGELSLFAISQRDPDLVLDRAMQCITATLGVEHAAAFEFEPGGGELVLRAGRGWSEGRVGSARITAGPGNRPGYDANRLEPVVVEDFGAETDASTAELFLEEGIVSGMAVPVDGRNGSWGVLGAYATRSRSFSPVQVEFLQSVARVIGAVLERVHMERELVESRERLAVRELKKEAERAEELAALGTLAAGMAHEVNNPLNAIMVNAELGLLRAESGQDGEKIRESFRTITAEVQRCADIMKRVLDLAKDGGAPKSLCDLNQSVRQARELVDSHLQIHDAAVELDLAELPPLLIDPVSMEGALVNLFRNAAEAREKGITVSTRTWLQDDGVHLSVADDGPGIPSEHIDQIFDPFFTSKGRTKGTGLGLSIVRRTITDHGGTIEVHSRPGQGTEFHVRLPVPSDLGNSNPRTGSD